MGCIDTEASLAGPALTLSPSQEVIGVRRRRRPQHTHDASLLDDGGDEHGTLLFANTPEGYRQLVGWLGERGARSA
jgi:hypothetical protein